MMNKILQGILILSSTLFFTYIFNMVRVKKLELKYALVWILTSFSFVILALYPHILRVFSDILHIIEPVNTVFLCIIFFLLAIVFTLTLSISRNANRVKTLTQEMGIIRMELEEMKKAVNDGK